MPDPSRPTPPRLTLDDHLLIEAVAVLEGPAASGGRAIPAARRTAAERAARGRSGAPFHERLLHRARELSRAPELAELPSAIRRVHRMAGLVAAGFLVSMALLGYAAAATVLEAGGAQREVNVYWALLALLGFQTFMLLLWAGVTFALPRKWGGGEVRGSVLGGLTGRLTGWFHPTRTHHAAGRALGRTLGRDPIRRWVLAAFTHAVWSTFNLAAIVGLLLMLSFRHYLFTWETTILTPEAFGTLSDALGRLPAALGLPVPGPEQVTATQRPADPDVLTEARHAWAGFLLGTLVLYGLLPRLVLLVVSVSLARRAIRRRDPADALPPALRDQLRQRLAPASRSLGVVDPDTGTPAAEGEEAMPDLPIRPLGPPAILGFEIEPPEAWPPVADGIALEDLGFIDDHQAQRELLEQLRTSTEEPAALVVACSLPTTPDRGTGRFLGQLRRSLRRPVLLLLTHGRRLREQGDDGLHDRRIEQWSDVAGKVGLSPDRILEFDFDRAEEADRERLAGALSRVLPGTELSS